MRKPLIIAFVVACTGAVFAQDPLKIDPAHYKVALENASVRVLRVSVGAGEKSAMHAHPDAIIIPMVTSKVRFTMPDGKSEDRDMVAESASYSPAGSHATANLGQSGVEALVVEFRTAAAGKATLPASRPGMTLNVLAEGPRAMAYRSTAAPAFAEAAGTTHEYDQIVIALGSAQMSLSVAGQPAKTTWARGDAVFIPRGTGHEAKNLSGEPVEFIIVSIR